MNCPHALRNLLLADLGVNWTYRGVEQAPSSWLDIVRSVGDVRFLPVVLIRAGAHLTSSNTAANVLGKVFLMLARLLFGVEVAAQSQIGPGLYFPHTGGIVIGAARIGENCVIYHGVTLGAKGIDMPFTPALRPTVGDNVVIAAGAKVLGGVTVGSHSVVGANAVVTHDVTPASVVGGVPAVPLRQANV